ncbi:MAG: WD40 repeat domain-containing protein [Elusimicrobiales bacterium]
MAAARAAAAAVLALFIPGAQASEVESAQRQPPPYSRTFETGGWTNSVAWSPDGHMFCAASSDGFARVWDKDGNLLKTGALGEASCAVFSPDGKYLAAGGAGGVFLYRLPSMEAAGELSPRKTIIKSLAWSPDGKYLAAASLDGSVTLAGFPALKKLCAADAHEGGAAAVSFSPDGKLLASAGYDRTVKLWRLPDMQPERTLRGFNGNVNAAVFSPDGKFLAAAADDRSIRIWRAKDWKNILAEEKAHKDALNAAAWSPDGKLIATAGDDGFVRLWLAEDMTRVRTIKNYNLSALSLAFSPDGTQLSAGYLLGTARIWNWKRETAVITARKAFINTGKDKLSLRLGERITLQWDENPTGRIVYAETDSARGRVKRKLLGFSDRFAPVIRIISKTREGRRLRIKGVVYDDCAVSDVTIAGRDAEWASGKAAYADYSDAFPFTAEIALPRSGPAPLISAQDYAGHRSSLALTDAPAEHWAPQVAEIKAARPAPLMSAVDSEAKVVRMVPAGEPLLAVGYRKNWYRLDDGLWISADAVTGR